MPPSEYREKGYVVYKGQKTLIRHRKEKSTNSTDMETEEAPQRSAIAIHVIGLFNSELPMPIPSC